MANHKVSDVNNVDNDDIDMNYNVNNIVDYNF